MDRGRRPQNRRRQRVQPATVRSSPQINALDLYHVVYSDDMSIYVECATIWQLGMIRTTWYASFLCRCTQGCRLRKSRRQIKKFTVHFKKSPSSRRIHGSHSRPYCAHKTSHWNRFHSVKYAIFQSFSERMEFMSSMFIVTERRS